MKIELEQKLHRINRRIDILWNCCRQSWASKKEIDHWKKGISECIDEANKIKEAPTPQKEGEKIKK